MLQFILKLLFVVLLGRLLAGALRLLVRRSQASIPRRETKAQAAAPKLRGDIVEAEFEELDPQEEKE
ncbi:MAG: hypothetical protein JSW67_03545 [Candidatus Latescibacterota bacterium]|nr:MAG: hypothetical protein JSW67_03545 [Candidatus Latescibacterota bacterium]